MPNHIVVGCTLGQSATAESGTWGRAPDDSIERLADEVLHDLGALATPYTGLSVTEPTAAHVYRNTALKDGV